MTRPMPGPPGGFTDRARLNYALLGKQITYEQYQEFGDALTRAFTARPKRMTDAECAAEFWRAEGDHCLASEGYDIDWFSGDLLRDEDIACDVHATWHRFATHPHALDAT